MSTILETRRVVAQLVLDVADGFAGTRAAPGGGRVRPRTPVRARVLRRVTAPVETFDPPWQLVTTTTPGGFLAWFGQVRPDSAAGGAAGPELDRVGVLEPGTYDIDVAAAGYQPNVLQAAIPAVGAPPSVLTVDLEAAPDYAFPGESADVTDPPVSRSTGPTLLRGQILALDGSGLAGVPVTAPLAVPAVTDRKGSWVLVFPDTQSGQVTVTATIAGAAVTAASAILSRRRTTVPQARLRGRTVGQSGAPVAGAVISVAGVAGTVTSGPDGSWSLALPFGTGLQPINVTISAVAGPTTQTQAGVAVVPGGSVTVPDHVFPNL